MDMLYHGMTCFPLGLVGFLGMGSDEWVYFGVTWAFVSQNKMKPSHETI